ncbi:MAG: hypothetical protein ABSD20_02930 [Terriglobales bacterium]|jgi:hypothetical protein
MDTRQILADLRAERDRIDQAIVALETLSGIAAPFRDGAGMPRKGGARHMSAAARKRISERMKEHWAERKKKVGNGRHMSAAARKRISEKMKQSWAERKAER